MNDDKIVKTSGGMLSKQKYAKIASETNVITIEKIDPKDILKIDNYIVSINQKIIEKNLSHEKINRAYLASKLGIKAGELNKALQHNSPKGYANNAVKRCIRILENLEKTL